MGGVCCFGEKRDNQNQPLLRSVSSVEQTGLNRVEDGYKPPEMVKTIEKDSSSKVKRFKMSEKVGPQDFETIKCIGKGSFAKVMMVKKKDTGKTYAMKMLTKKDLVRRKQIQHTMTERAVISEIDHPFIVSLHFAFQSDTRLYLVTDFFNGGELFWHLKHSQYFTESRARFYAAEIVLALECLHDNGIVYRDMKPENLLLDADGHIRLTDFGLSKDSLKGETLTHTFCGTPEYLAPEVIKQEGYGKSVDWWALGVLIYEMLSGLPPFYDKNLREMYDHILTAPIPFPPNFSASVKEIIQGLMEREPQNRLGSAGADEVKQANWFITIDFDKLLRKDVPVPYKPTLDGDDDWRNVDEEFLEERTEESFIQRTGSVLAAQAKFPGFTYQNQTSAVDEY